MPRVICLYVVALVLLTTAMNLTAQESFSDGFDNGAVDPAFWTIDDPGAVSVVEAGGVLIVSAGVIGGYAQVELECNHGAVGDFDVAYDYCWINGVGSSRTRTQLWVHDLNGGDGFSLNFWRGGGYPDGDLIWSHGSSVIGHTWNPPAIGALRIRREGQVFTAYYKLSGMWHSLGATLGFSGPGAIVLNGNTNGGSAFEVRWDNFVLLTDSSIVDTDRAAWGSIKALYR